MTPAEHRQLGVDLFNRTWTFLDSESRTRDEDDEMIHCAHASAYHWLHAEGSRPENRARSEWQLSRVYAVLGHGEAALRHASRCLDHCTENGIADWDIAFAYEALARAHKTLGDDAAFEREVARARRAGEAIDCADDREYFEREFGALTA